jgi:hypothetical protein
MRLSLPTFSLLTLYLASKAFACVVFSVNVFMYAGNQYEVVGSLIDNGGEVCTVGEDVDPTQIDFVWLNCVDNYAATFSWVGTGSVAYAYPGIISPMYGGVKEMKR